MANMQKVLKVEIELIKPDKDISDKINKITKDFCLTLKSQLKKKKIKAEVFIGGSLAKNTLVVKEIYDVDIFVRFDEKYRNQNISKLLGKVLGKKAKKIHGSRDYYQIKFNKIIIEIVPVLKIAKPEQAQNITDLSYFHVNYLLKKIKQKKKLCDEIRLAKTFAYAQDCYGAESYINGFSGYALELLICYYGSFLKFIKSISSVSHQNNKVSKSSSSSKSNKILENKLIIDMERLYKNREEILRELNKSKLQSPMVLIDPTFKQRNALAGLSKQTFEKFKIACEKLLKKPSCKSFQKKNIFDRLYKKYGTKLKIISIKTNKQAGDIAGSKSKKFFGFFIRKLGREFAIKKAEFTYNEKKNEAFYYLVLGKKKDEVIKGPPVTAVHNLTKFRKAHTKAFIKNHFAYAKISHKLSLERFMLIFLKKNKKIIKQMCIKKVKLI